MTLPATIVGWCEPEPPFGELFRTDVDAVKPHWRTRGVGTATFLVPRTDPNAAALAALLARCVPLVKITREDAVLPFVGFPMPMQFKGADTHGAFQLMDHTSRLALANTRIAAETKKPGGQFIVDEFTAAEQRGEPPLYLDLRLVAGGPNASFALSAQKCDALLREMESQADYDSFFSYQIDAGVTTFLRWEQRQGIDHRGDDEWVEGDQLANVQYNIDNTKGLKAITTVGGTGSVPNRPSVTANSGGKSIGATTVPTIVPSRGVGGGRVDFVQGVTDPTALAARAQQAIVAPQNAVISWEFDILESAIDMSKLNVGDTRYIASPTAFMGQPVEGLARIIGLELNPMTGVHHAVAVEVV